jgi:ABC-type Fe3+ transport system permease subunit
MPSLVLEATWAAAGDTVIISLAALIGVPAELYDAADVDGASIWRKIWHITLPQLRGVLLVTLILQVIGSQVFLEPFLFTGGGPANSTLMVLLLIYNYAFGSSLGGDYVAATASSLMLAVFLAPLSALYFWLTRSCGSSRPQWGAQGIPVIAARRARSPREGRSATVRGDQRKKKRDRSGRRRALRLSHRSLQERQGSPSGAHIGAAATMWPQTAE